MYNKGPYTNPTTSALIILDVCRRSFMNCPVIHDLNEIRLFNCNFSNIPICRFWLIKIRYK